MTLAIVPLSTGKRLTEPGWYIRQGVNGDRDVVEVICENGVLSVYCVGNEVGDLISEADTFIARIYPERIVVTDSDSA